MGLSSFPSPAEGVLPVLVMNTVLSVALLKNMVRSVLHVVGASSNLDEEDSPSPSLSSSSSNEEASGETGAAATRRRRRRRISITRYESLCKSRCDIATSISSPSSSSGGNNYNNSRDSSSSSKILSCSTMECCVCLCRFGAEEEVSELSCKHFFHKCCLDKWFDNHHTTCPLCRSIM